MVSWVLGSMVPCFGEVALGIVGSGVCDAPFGEVALGNLGSGICGICGKQDEAVTSLSGVAEGPHLINT